MKEYIDKATLVAAVKERLKYNSTRAELDRSAFMAGREKEDEDILTLLDTLEVKEVDLDDKDKWKNTGGFGSTWDPDSPDYYPD